MPSEAKAGRELVRSGGGRASEPTEAVKEGWHFLGALSWLWLSRSRLPPLPRLGATEAEAPAGRPSGL